MNQNQTDDFTARLHALENVLTYIMARYLENLPERQSQGIKDSFFGQNQELGAGIMPVERLQNIQQLIEAHVERILIDTSNQEGRTWSRPE